MVYTYIVLVNWKLAKNATMDPVILVSQPKKYGKRGILYGRQGTPFKKLGTTFRKQLGTPIGKTKYPILETRYPRCETTMTDITDFWRYYVQALISNCPYNDRRVSCQCPTPSRVCLKCCDLQTMGRERGEGATGYLFRFSFHKGIPCA